MPNYFIGIDLSNTALHQKMQTIQHRLDRSLEWAYTKTPHMTLVYVGPKSENEIQWIVDQLSVPLNNIHSTEIQVSDIDIWHTYRHLGVLILKENNILSQIQEKIRFSLREHIQDTQTPFVPHVTIYASKKHLKKSAQEALRTIKEALKNHIQKINTISLMYIDPDSKKIITVNKFPFE